MEAVVARALRVPQVDVAVLTLGPYAFSGIATDFARRSKCSAGRRLPRPLDPRRDVVPSLRAPPRARSTPYEPRRGRRGWTGPQYRRGFPPVRRRRLRALSGRPMCRDSERASTAADFEGLCPAKGRSTESSQSSMPGPCTRKTGLWLRRPLTGATATLRSPTRCSTSSEVPRASSPER